MRYASIRQLDISNGPGIGVSLFVQGCHFHCKNCFNSCTWDFSGGTKWTTSVEDYFLSLIDRPYIDRVSILGGEPFANENVADVYDLITKIRKIDNTKKIWVYTGYSFENIMANGLKYSTLDSHVNQTEVIRYLSAFAVDVVVDGLYIDDKRDFNLKWRGSSNQKVIDVKATYNKYQQSLFDNGQIRCMCKKDMIKHIADSIVIIDD